MWVCICLSVCLSFDVVFKSDSMTKVPRTQTTFPKVSNGILCSYKAQQSIVVVVCLFVCLFNLFLFIYCSPSLTE